jgi:hypothetical protein
MGNPDLNADFIGENLQVLLKDMVASTVATSTIT